MKESLYENYTTTSVLSGVDPEKFTAWSHQYFRRRILPWLPTDKSASILEIGCGYGRYTTLLCKELKYTQVTGMDISEEQIQYAREKMGLDNVICKDAVSYLEENSTTYDAVILMDVLEHLELEYAIRLLRLIRTSLKSGGKLIIQVPNGLSPMTPIFHGDVTHVRAFSVNSMSQLLRMAGFSSFEHHALPPFVHGLKSLIHRTLWSLLIHPLVYVFLTLSHGSAVGGIYSSNLLTIAHQNK